MSLINGFSRGKHRIYKMHIHLVLVPKYRKGCFTDEILKEMEVIMSNVCSKSRANLEEFNGEYDHVHLLIDYMPDVNISILIGRLKGASAYILRRKFKDYLSKYLWGKHLWSPSYFVVSCGGAPLETIKKYIQNQDRPMDFKNVRRDHTCKRGREFNSEWI